MHAVERLYRVLKQVQDHLLKSVAFSLHGQPCRGRASLQPDALFPEPARDQKQGTVDGTVDPDRHSPGSGLARKGAKLVRNDADPLRQPVNVRE